MKLDVVAIYELLGSRQTNFVLLDKQNQIITSRSRALRNNSTVFQAFFNLQAVKSVCVDHGIVFQEECKKSSKEMIYAGTDYGVVTMSTTVSFD
jgi:hypothetical protein